jgi:hypothetical protein
MRRGEERFKAACLVVLVDDGRVEAVQVRGGAVAQGLGFAPRVTNALQRLDVSRKYSVQSLPHTVMGALNLAVSYISWHGRLHESKGLFGEYLRLFTWPLLASMMTQPFLSGRV